MVFTTLTVLSLIAVLLLLVSYMRVLYAYVRKAKLVHTVTSSNANVNASLKNPVWVEKQYKQAPGPIPWPIIGNLNLLGRYKVPFEAFTELAKDYGDAYSLTLGTTRCLIVNNLELIREVLNQNGKFFGGRPDFLRYHMLFGGDRNNSLALCDWSQLQQKRRNLARRHCSPRDSSSFFTKMSSVGGFETDEFMCRLQEQIIPGESFQIKPLIQQACANMFSQYMCSVRFDYEDTEFQKIVENFDEIFWEINQGYAVDFLPWLAPFYKNHIRKIINWSATIRKFILERVINDREQNIDIDEPEKDFTDALLKSLAEDENVSRDMIIFMLEDFIGGHSAVGNLVMLALAYIAKNPEVGKNIQQEAARVTNAGGRTVNLYDMEAMPYTLATIFEVLRYSSSPIVPHVATEDAVISGYGVTTGTIVFINNYKLNTSEQYWENPAAFEPKRFLETVAISSTTNNISTQKVELKRRNSEGSDSGVEFEKESSLNTSLSEGHISSSRISFLENIKAKTNEETKNEQKSETLRLKKNISHFLPFSIGKRTCIGQNLVRGFGFILLANILQKYDVSCQDLSEIQIKPACVALPAKTFPLVLTQRVLTK